MEKRTGRVYICALVLPPPSSVSSLSDGHGVRKASRGPLRSDTQNMGAAARLCSTPSLGGGSGFSAKTPDRIAFASGRAGVQGICCWWTVASVG